jgi:hypothetical protein
VQFTASHRFDQPFADVAGAFLDPDAHVRRYELMGHRDIQVLHLEETTGALDLKTVRTVEGEVPALASKIIKSTNTVTTTDRWEQADGSTLLGTVLIEASNVPGTATITATVAPDGSDGCTYDLTMDLALKIPLIGDRFVTLLKPQVMEIIDAEFEAWDGYLARAAAP